MVHITLLVYNILQISYLDHNGKCIVHIFSFTHVVLNSVEFIELDSINELDTGIVVYDL